MTSDTVTPPVGCPVGCLPPPPMGWTGPSAVYDGPSAMKPSACPSKVYVQKEVEAHRGLNAPSASCSCGAPAFQNVQCRANVSVFGTAQCNMLSQPQGSFTMPGGPCLTLSNNGFTQVTPAFMLDAGTCTFPSATKNVQPATFTAVHVACGAPQNAACTTDSRCVATPLPDAPFTRLCIHKDGDVQCPSADYSIKLLAHKTLTDTRDCAACVGVVQGGMCGDKWGTAGTQQACVNSPPATNNFGCGPQLTAGTIVGGAIAPTGMTCVNDGGTPLGTSTGGALSADPVTFCCHK